MVNNYQTYCLRKGTLLLEVNALLSRTKLSDSRENLVYMQSVKTHHFEKKSSLFIKRTKSADNNASKHMKCLFATSYLFMSPHQNQQAQAMKTYEDL